MYMYIYIFLYVYIYIYTCTYVYIHNKCHRLRLTGSPELSKNKHVAVLILRIQQAPSNREWCLRAAAGATANMQGKHAASCRYSSTLLLIGLRLHN